MSRTGVRLSFAGKDARRPAREVRRVVVQPGERGLRLVQGDNVESLRSLAGSLAGRATLAYLDPPFFTGRAHERTERTRDAATGKTLRTRSPAFDDRWPDLGAYLAALGERLEAVRPLLAPHGSVVVHVDPKTSHYVRVLGDEIFGDDAFASEIVWRYRRWPSKTPNFQRVHDVLLRWVKDPRTPPRFEQLYEPLAASTRATWGEGKQRAIVGTDGRRARSSTLAEPSPGVPLGDVWEIGIVAPIARERTGYPTQKPEALLDRLLRACTREGDLVIDPYAGSGTTLAVAARLGRAALGCDESPVAIQVALERLRGAGHAPTWERVEPAPAERAAAG